MLLMDRDSVEVFLPNPNDCYERFRRARFGATESCVLRREQASHQEGNDGKRRSTVPVKECEMYFNDLTDSIFEHRKFPIEEMF